MKSIPARPKMSREETEIVQEQFMRGERIQEPKIAAKPAGTKNPAGKGNVKMYNLALPVDVHAKAKMFALMEGKSLAEYIVNAVSKANEKLSGRSGL